MHRLLYQTVVLWNWRQIPVVFFMHLLSALREKWKVQRKRKEIAGEKEAWIKEERARRADEGDRLLCLLAWHVPRSHDVNQRTCLSRGRELFLGQVQRSIPRGMIDAPVACNGLCISSSRMRKLHDREKGSNKSMDLWVFWNFRKFFFSTPKIYGSNLKFSLDEINSWKKI